MPPTIQITVLYFASLADRAGRDQETMTLDAAATLTDLYTQLDGQYQFDRTPASLRVAINDHFADWSDTIHSGDRIAFIPPVAGG